MTNAIRKTIFTAAAATLAILLQCPAGMAQSLPGPAWYVIGSGGGSATFPFQGSTGWDNRFDSAVISYTVGESCIAFDHSSFLDVTEGFQQPDGYGIKPYDPFDAIGQVIFYPNPCKQFSFVSFSLNESFTNVTLKVFNIAGKLVYTDEFQAGDGVEKYQLPTTAMAPGMYIVEIVGFTKKRYVGKLIVIP